MTEDLPKSNNIDTLVSYDTVYSADSIEWCPHNPNKHVFVCACYQLINSNSDEELEPKKRTGKLMLFSIKNNLELLQTFETAAILDQKWCPNQINNNSLLGVVNAMHSLEIYKLDSEKVQLELVTIYKLPPEDTETLILSLDWSTGKHSSNNPEIVCSTSKGTVLLFKLQNNELILENENKSHGFEAWIVGFYYWDVNIFFSGGDDSCFFKYDKRVGSAPISKNKSHEAGVTSFHSNISKEYIVATGSYDECIRLWDMRNFKTPLNSQKMPGPVWRLKWDPFVQIYLLAACMLGGAHIVKSDGSAELEICESYYEHKNIVYGSDWSHLTTNELDCYDFKENCLIGTCSFYDHLLCISKLSIQF